MTTAVYLTACACGCGDFIAPRKRYGKRRAVRFIHGHNRVGQQLAVTKLTKAGYRIISNRGKRTFEHVLIAERILGRPLPDNVQVHHHNQNPADNRNENLVICENDAYHKLLHVRMRIFKAGGDPSIHKICGKCKELQLRTYFGVKRQTGDKLNVMCRRCVVVLHRIGMGWSPRKANAVPIREPQSTYQKGR